MFEYALIESSCPFEYGFPVLQEQEYGLYKAQCRCVKEQADQATNGNY